MSTTSPLYIIGRALLGYTADNTNTQIGIRQQHDILKAAALHQIIAAKVAIERYYPTQQAAILLADCYITAKSRQYSVAS